MTVVNYIKTERDRLRAKHSGETFLCCGGESVHITQTVERTAVDILRELNCLQGLNVKERVFARRALKA